MALNHAIGLGSVIIVVAACLTPALCTVPYCVTRAKLADQYEKCFNERGLYAPEVFSNFRTNPSNAPAISPLPEAELYRTHAHTFCTNFTAQFKRAVRCIIQVHNDCAREQHTELLPFFHDSTEIFCRNYQNMDFDCAIRKRPTLIQCGMDARRKLKGSSDLKCRAYRASAQCLKKEYKECGCTTARAYAEVIYYVFMSWCDDDSSPVVCNATNPDLFLDDGLRNGSSTVVASHFLELVVALAILVVSTRL